MSSLPAAEENMQQGDGRLRKQFFFADAILQIISAGILFYFLWPAVSRYQLAGFSGALVIILFSRLLLLSRTGNAAGPDNKAGIGILLSSMLNGALWGFAAVIIASLDGEHSPSVNMANVILIAVTISAFIGSALRPGPYLAFSLPALGSPLAFSILLHDVHSIIIWALFFMVSITLAATANKYSVMLARIRTVTRQNASLLQNLATARNQALKHQQQVVQANNDLQLQMEERERAEQQIRASERELSGILEDLQDTYIRLDADNIIRRISQSVQLLLGYTPEMLIGSHWDLMLADTTDSGNFLSALDARHGHLHNYEICFRHQDGNEVWVSISAHYVYSDSTIVGIEGTARDITEKRRADEALFGQKERLHVTLESIGDGVITTDLDGLVEYLNPRAEEMTGWKTAAALGNPLAAVMNLVDEDKGKLVELPIADWMDEGRRVALQEPAMLVHKDGNRQSAIELTGAPIRDSSGTVAGTVLVFHDVTKMRSLAKQLAYQATHDALTGLPNRIEFEKRAEQALRTAQSGKKQHAIFYIDLDQFKVVNDTCGHHAGDLLLQQITSLMQGLLRVSDTLARLGGDEFGVLLPGCPLHMAEAIAEKLRAAVDEYRFVWEGEAFRVGLSIGVVPVLSGSTGLTEILQSADSACYVAKERGRNRVHVSHPADVQVAEHRDKMQWMQRIQKALDEDLFTLYFQAIHPAGARKAASGLHGEILLRMKGGQEDVSSLIGPSSFLPTAERFHLMPQIDRWVINNALEAITRNTNAGIRLDMCAINISGQSMGDMEMLDFILKKLKSSSVSPHIICFEITESAVISNLDYARQFIIKLKEIGCSFALDDFGSGLSSFDYLKNLPVDYVKLDGSLIRDVATNKVSQAMVHAINYVAHVMGMKSVAEYVENDEILQQLRRISIDYVQGYAITRPLPFTANTLLTLDKAQ